MTVEPTVRIRQSRYARKFLQLLLTTTPAVTTWEASFDSGVTWLTGTPVGGQANTYRWLVAGSGVTIGSAVVQLGVGSYIVHIRAVDAPELEVREAVVEIY